MSAHQDELRANWRAPRGQGGGAVREGTALLQGRVRCGRCGRMMQVGYSGTERQHSALSLRPEQAALWRRAGLPEPRRAPAREPGPRGGLRRARAGQPGRHAPRRSPRPTPTTASHVAVFELAVERARFEAERARRQFDAVEPENRLVARTLERSLEEALSAQRQAEANLAAQRLRQPTRLTERGDGLARARRRRRPRHASMRRPPPGGSASSCCGRSSPRWSSPCTPRSAEPR